MAVLRKRVRILQEDMAVFDIPKWHLMTDSKVHCMKKHVMSKLINFEVYSFICSKVMIAANFENFVSRKMDLR